MKWRRIFFLNERKKKKKKKEENIKRFILTKMTLFHFMSVRLIGWNKIRFGSLTA